MFYRHKAGVTLRKMDHSDLCLLLDLKRESWWGTHRSLIVNHEDQYRWFNSLPADSLYMVGMPDHNDWPDVSSRFGVACYTEIDWTGRTLNIAGSVIRECRKPSVVEACFCAGLDFAFEILNMHRVQAEVLECNTPSLHLELDLLGFIVEGRRRQAVYKSGRYYDSLQLGLLRTDWQEQQRVKDYGDTCNMNFSHDVAVKMQNSYIPGQPYKRPRKKSRRSTG